MRRKPLALAATVATAIGLAVSATTASAERPTGWVFTKQNAQPNCSIALGSFMHWDRYDNPSWVNANWRERGCGPPTEVTAGAYHAQ